MIVDDATRIRVVRAFLGMDSKSFSARIGVCVGTLTNYERGRSSPAQRPREELAKLCQENGICFTPSGYPLPVIDHVVFKQEAVQEQ